MAYLSTLVSVIVSGFPAISWVLYGPQPEKIPDAFSPAQVPVFWNGRLMRRMIPLLVPVVPIETLAHASNWQGSPAVPCFPKCLEEVRWKFQLRFYSRQIIR